MADLNVEAKETTTKEGWRTEIAYNENGEKLSFKTNVDTVFYDENTSLKEWLDKLKKDLTKQIKKEISDSNNNSGGTVNRKTYTRTISEFIVTKKEMTDEELSLIVDWRSSSPAVTIENPYLYERLTIYTIFLDNEEIKSLEVKYYYKGKYGDTFIDTAWKEWIFKVTSLENTTEDEVKLELQKELDASFEDVDYQTPDFVPKDSGWTDDRSQLESSKYIEWCASRYNKNGVWSKFDNLHITGRLLPKGSLNNIYAKIKEKDDLGNEIFNETWWENDYELLINNIKLDIEDGHVKNFPEGLKYEWMDFVPNSDPEDIIYQANCYFVEEDCSGIDHPFRITGKAGAGSDGDTIEFAYCASETSEFPPEIDRIHGTPEHFYSMEGGPWYDTAGECPISLERPYQFQISRKGHWTDENNWYWYKGNQAIGIGSNAAINISELSDEEIAEWNYGWSEPSLWSSWGQDGVDGDGVLYVYLRLTEDEYNFVKDHPERWNFDGGIQDQDPGNVDDENSPNNPNNPINCKYVYSLKTNNYQAKDFISYNGQYITITDVEVTCTIYNLEGNQKGDPIVKTIPELSLKLDLSKNTPNISYEDIKKDIAVILVDDLFNFPEYSVASKNSDTVYPEVTVQFTRNKVEGKVIIYYVLCEEINGNSTSIIDYKLISNFSSNPLIGAQVYSNPDEEFTINAPEIPNYTIQGNNSYIIRSSDAGKAVTITFNYKRL